MLRTADVEMPTSEYSLAFFFDLQGVAEVHLGSSCDLLHQQRTCLGELVPLPYNCLRRMCRQTSV